MCVCWGVPGCTKEKKVKKLPASGGDVRDTGLIPRPGKSPGGRHGNPL